MTKNTDNTTNLYHWKYYLIVGIIFLIGVILMLYAENRHTENYWFRFVGELGAFIAAAIASHFIYDKFLRKDEELLLIEKLSNLQHEKESGITSSYNKLPLQEFLNEVKTAKHSLRILQTWIANFISLEDALRIAIEKNISVEVLILNPNSNYAATRGLELGMVEDTDHVPREINSNLSRLFQLSAELRHPANFKVKLYDSSGTFDIYAVDNIIYLGFFWRKKNSIEAPHLRLKLRGDDFYFGYYTQLHFDSIWENAKQVNFTDINWRNNL
jgi:hypothetical protein